MFELQIFCPSTMASNCDQSFNCLVQGLNFARHDTIKLRQPYLMDKLGTYFEFPSAFVVIAAL